MTTAHPSDPIAPSYADLLAQNARLQQQLDAQKQHYQQQAAQLKQQYQQQMDAQRQQYEAKLARINQELTDAITKPITVMANSCHDHRPPIRPNCAKLC